MIAEFVARIVDLAQRRAVAVVLAILALVLAAGWYAAGTLSLNSDVEQMLPSEPAWRQRAIELDRAFPQNADLLAIVIDGDSPDLADGAARRLTEKMRAEPELFRYVRQPDGGPFFDRNGLLFLPIDDLTALSQDLITAQPLLGSLAYDPSLRGLFHALSLFAEGAAQGHLSLAELDPMLAKMADAIEAALAGQFAPIAWQELMSSRKPDPRELRRFVLTRPVLDFSGLQPGAKATGEIRRLAATLDLDPQHGVRVRITGPVALDDEQFATLQQGALASTTFSLVSVCVVLFAALRSVRLVAAILATLIAGLVLTAGFAAVAIGSLNLMSVAFGVLFIGLGVDFSIQFSIRYRDQRHRRGSLVEAIVCAGRSIGPSLVLAAGATAVGFLAFIPTEYRGVRELGWIAGIGMAIALALNFLLLPALLLLLRPRGEPEPIGFRRAALLDRLLRERRRWVIAGGTALGALCVALLPRVSFDFDPLHLKNAGNESVATALDLMNDPTTSPYSIQVLAPSLDAARQLAGRLAQLPEVAQVVDAESYIPEDQDQKLAIIADMGMLLGPTLFPPQTLPAPSDAEIVKAMAACRDALRRVAGNAPGQAARLADALDKTVARGEAIIPALRRALLDGVLRQLELIKQVLQAKPVTLADLPPELRDSWVTPDGRARIEVFPRGDARDNAVLTRFVAAVRTVAPDATGSPVTIEEAGRLISRSFLHAGLIAVAAITVLLALVLRRAREVALVIAPLLLAAVMTLAITALVGMKLNYANIIALPLLLGIGVAFDIYFVMNWRAGMTDHLQSSTARAVLFSAVTTMLAFGSLALSDDPGTAGMGKLLALSLACTLFCTLLILPALLGPATRHEPTDRSP